MKTIMTIYGAIIMVGTMFLLQQSKAQKLEVVGEVKIAVMNQSNTAENLVAQLPDGTLEEPEVSSLSGNTNNYGTVVNPVTGKIWLDRNLGATQVATSSTDTLSYGDLYQWGRAADGHQIPSSTITTAQATYWLADESDTSFITNNINWLNANVTDLWSGTAAENNPCPPGFRLPTNAEWNQERRTWSTNDAAGAFASPLKLPMAGFRDYSDGSLNFVGTYGGYWSSTVSDTNSNGLAINNVTANTGPASRAFGFSVRCIKN